MVCLILINWIVIYPMDSAIQLLNNWDLKDAGPVCIAVLPPDKTDKINRLTHDMTPAQKWP